MRADVAEYQKNHAGANASQLEMIRNLTLSYEEFTILSRYCEDIGIDFLSTAFDLESVSFLNSIGIKAWKIPSGEINNLPYLIAIANLGNPVILSTGMSTLQEVKNAIAILTENGAGEITILHCTTEYPAPFSDVNLSAMITIKEEFRMPIGYSDHTEGIEVSIAAAALGANIIEKHFTLSRDMEGPDHRASLEPNELKSLIAAIRNIEKAMGSGRKYPAPSELKNIEKARKSIVAKRSIQTGESFSKNNITTKRPGDGISPMLWFDVLGKKAKRDFEEDELIEL